MKAVFSVLVAMSLTACATHSPDVIHPYEAQRMSHLSDATILSVRPVTIDGYQTGAGASIGAIAGGVAAANAASYHNSGWAGFVGAIAGGLLGNAVERSATTQNAVELLLQMRNGERRSIVQATGSEAWMVGEPVVLVTTGGRTRVTRAPQAAPQAVPQAYPVPPAYPAPQAYPAPAAMPAPVPVYPPSGPVPPRS
jgi:outer membrane lipoprotein SlyB